MENIKEFKLTEKITSTYRASDSFTRYLLKSVLSSFSMSLIIFIVLMDFILSLGLWWEDDFHSEMICFAGFFELLLIFGLSYSIRQYSRHILKENLCHFTLVEEIKSMLGTNERAIFHIDNFLKNVQKEDFSEKQLLRKVLNDQLETIIRELHELNIKAITKFEKIISDPVLWGITGLMTAFSLTAITTEFDVVKAALFFIAVIGVIPLVFRFLGLFSENGALQKKKAFLAFSLLKEIEFQSSK